MSADNFSNEQLASVISSGIVAALEPFRMRVEAVEERVRDLEAVVGNQPRLEDRPESINPAIVAGPPPEPAGPTMTATSLMRTPAGGVVVRYAMPRGMGTLVAVIAENGDLRIRHERDTRVTHYRPVEM